MSLWPVIFLVVGILLLVGALGAGAWFGWNAYQRRILLRLLARAEAVDAAVQAIEDSMARLSIAGDDDLMVFAQDPDSVERRTLHEVSGRAEMLRDEFDTMRLPPAHRPLADGYADAAHLIAREAGCVTDADIGEVALEKLASMDLTKVRAYTRQAKARLVEACSDAGLEDTAVYGGGLYL